MGNKRNELVRNASQTGKISSVLGFRGIQVKTQCGGGFQRPSCYYYYYRLAIVRLSTISLNDGPTSTAEQCHLSRAPRASWKIEPCFREYHPSIPLFSACFPNFLPVPQLSRENNRVQETRGINYCPPSKYRYTNELFHVFDNSISISV